MESARELKISEIKKIERQSALERWLDSTCHVSPSALQPMAGDASLRRYFRVQIESQSFIVMDAPPPENCQAFAAISSALRKLGLQTPEIIHADFDQGFLLITDFGDATYLKTLTADNADQLYQAALTDLAVLQSCRQFDAPPFTADFMAKEWEWHKEWMLDKFLGLSAGKELDACYQLLVESAITQPQVFMHRDFHSANLMVLPQGKVGILDFQDAFIGPLTYDLVSLLRDCYIDWPRDRVQNWALFYLRTLQAKGLLNQVSDQQFLRWFDLMGMQRHLKALLTFARKHVRDHQSHYLNHVPRTLGYLLSVSQDYPEFAKLHDYLKETVHPAFERVMK
jgi:aminoglycoside/choline kinase family phosphotransferase